MGAHHRRDDPGAASERPTFDEVPRGYDPRQVDDYLATLWRYASQVTSRAAAAEAALRRERERRDAEARLSGGPEQTGNRIGLMLAIAEQEADEIVTSARLIAERALEEAIEDAGANHPIVREAREQADKLLLDAVEESRRRSRDRHSDLEEQIVRSTSSLDTLRHQQGEIIGAMLRLRSLIGASEIDRAFAELAKAGASVPPPAEPRVPPPATPPPASPPSSPPPNEQASWARTATRVTARTAPRHVHSDVVDAEPYVVTDTAGHARAAYRAPSREDDIIDAEVIEE